MDFKICDIVISRKNRRNRLFCKLTKLMEWITIVAGFWPWLVAHIKQWGRHTRGQGFEYRKFWSTLKLRWTLLSLARWHDRSNVRVGTNLFTFGLIPGSFIRVIGRHRGSQTTLVTKGRVPLLACFRTSMSTDDYNKNVLILLKIQVRVLKQSRSI